MIHKNKFQMEENKIESQTQGNNIDLFHQEFEVTAGGSKEVCKDCIMIENLNLQLESMESFVEVCKDVMSSGEIRCSIQDRLFRMMEMSRTVIIDICSLARFSHVLKVSQHRANAVRWIKNVSDLSNVSVEARDTSVQIFDRFLGICLSENKNILGHSNDVALAAAVSVLIASKMHETRPLSMSSFVHLKTDDLIRFERLVITKLGFAIFPLTTPVSFIRYLISLWADGNEYPELVSTACHLTGDFYEAPEAPHFAPSTIALSALLLSFSKLGMDCSDWLEHVPNICLPSPTHPIFNTTFLVSFLDVDNCLSVLQRIQSHEVAKLVLSKENYVNPQTPAPSQVEDRMISPSCVCDLSPCDVKLSQQPSNNNITLPKHSDNDSNKSTEQMDYSVSGTGNIYKKPREDDPVDPEVALKRQRSDSVC